MCSSLRQHVKPRAAKPQPCTLLQPRPCTPSSDPCTTLHTLTRLRYIWQERTEQVKASRRILDHPGNHPDAEYKAKFEEKLQSARAVVQLANHYSLKNTVQDTELKSTCAWNHLKNDLKRDEENQRWVAGDQKEVYGVLAELGRVDALDVAHAIAVLLGSAMYNIYTDVESTIDGDLDCQWPGLPAKLQSSLSYKMVALMDSWQKDKQWHEGVDESAQKLLLLPTPPTLAEYGCLGYAVNLIQLDLRRAELYRRKIFYPVLRDSLVFLKKEELVRFKSECCSNGRWGAFRCSLISLDNLPDKINPNPYKLLNSGVRMSGGVLHGPARFCGTLLAQPSLDLRFRTAAQLVIQRTVSPPFILWKWLACTTCLRAPWPSWGHLSWFLRFERCSRPPTPHGCPPLPSPQPPYSSQTGGIARGGEAQSDQPAGAPGDPKERGRDQARARAEVRDEQRCKA